MANKKENSVNLVNPMRMDVEKKFEKASKKDAKKGRFGNYMPPHAKGELVFKDGLAVPYEISDMRSPKFYRMVCIEAHGQNVNLVIKEFGAKPIVMMPKELTFDELSSISSIVDRFVSACGEYNLVKKQGEAVGTKLYRFKDYSDGPARTRGALSTDAKPRRSAAAHGNTDRAMKAPEYKIPVWQCPGYYRKDGTYVVPCVKRRRCL